MVGQYLKKLEKFLWGYYRNQSQISLGRGVSTSTSTTSTTTYQPTTLPEYTHHTTHCYAPHDSTLLVLLYFRPFILQ